MVAVTRILNGDIEPTETDMKTRNCRLLRTHSPPLFLMQQERLFCCQQLHSNHLKQSIMKLLFIIILFVFTFSCCKKKPIEQEHQPVQITCALTKDLETCKSFIQGNWIWLEEKRLDRVQQSFVYLTPQNQGYSLSLLLSNDTARFYKNSQPDSVYTFSVMRLTEISGTNFPEDDDPVLVFYNLHNGMRKWHVPMKICSNFLLLQYQHVSSVGGEAIWKKQ